METQEMLAAAQAEARAGLAHAGDWLTARQRIAAWAELRDSATNPLDLARLGALSPTAVDGAHPATAFLDAAAVEVVHRVGSDPGRLTLAWARRAIDELGEETYTELVGVTAIASVLDRFEEILGRPLSPLPTPVDGEPTRERPDDVGDVGAWVSQSLEKTRANVSRTLTLVPRTQAVWRPLVDACYSRGAQFLDLDWDRRLSRPQAELVAARTTALNECFY